MNISMNLEESITKYDQSKTYIGYTLFAPIGGTDVWLIDMGGRVVWGWKMLYRPGCDAMLLPSGNLLYAGHVDGDGLASVEGSAGVVLEVDWRGNVIWKYEDEYLHHTFCRMDNGNSLVLKWIKTPDYIATKVKGGIPGTEPGGVLWSDCIQEVTRNGEVIWEWVAFEHLNPEVDAICPLCERTFWPGLNACSVLPDGNILTSFHRTHNVAIIDKSTGDVKWRWGLGEIAHQNAPSFLMNGNILIFDNGLHPHLYPMGFSRIVEVDPHSSEMVWAYEDSPRTNFYSSIMGSCQRLPNGNTLICEATGGRIFEITSGGSVVWEFLNPFFHESAIYGRNNMLSRAYRYGPDYEGLRGNTVEGAGFQPELQRKGGLGNRGARMPKDERAVRRRIDSLGY